MKRIILSILAALIPLSMMADTLQALESFRWKHRLILYSVSAQDAPTLVEALESNQHALVDRDLRLINLDAKETSVLDHHIKLSPQSLKALRTDLEIQSDTTELILIGKDGGIKERIDRIDLQLLFKAIDRMPMRRAEMRAARSPASE